MTAFRHWRTLAVIGLGLMMSFAASSWGKPQPPLPVVPAGNPLPLPTLPPGPPMPSPLDDLRTPPKAPAVPLPPAAIPVAPTPVVPVVPPPPAVAPPPALPMPELHFPAVPAPQPKPLASPPEPEILEPVVSVHRFSGKYLGGDSRRALVYVEKGDGKAEVQSRPLAGTIPEADAAAKDDVKRIEVPAGKVAEYDWRVFVTTPRELIVVNADCEIDWRFTLPGKADNGEKLLDVAGFFDGKLLLASQQESQPKEKAPATGRLYTLEVASGRQVAFATVPGGFDKDTQFAFNRAVNGLYAVSSQSVRAYELPNMAEAWKAELGAPTMHGAAGVGGLVTTLPSGFGIIHQRGFERYLGDAAGTATPTSVFDNAKSQTRLFVPLRSNAGENSLTAFTCFMLHSSPSTIWKLSVKQAITAAPVLHATSVYFVAGNILYRVNATTGAICWKQTLALKDGEVLTELAFTGGEIRASGPGVLVRIAERAEPPAPASKPLGPHNPFLLRY